MKHLNVICNPVKRWFHYEKEIPISIPENVTIHFVKDHLCNDVMCQAGWETYKVEQLSELNI